jgi:steroid 5-alpha reductase family enzyme
MNVPWPAWLAAEGAVLAAMFGLWLLSLKLRNASIVDPFWGPAFLLTAWVTAAMHWPPTARGTLMLGLVTVWAVRLGGYLLWRNSRHGFGHEGEDRRYGEMRQHHGERFGRVSLVTVFLLQGLLVGVIGWPVVCGVADRGDAPLGSFNGLGVFDWLGVTAWCVGFGFEAIGDRQLARFQHESTNRGKVLDRGLWRYTRHPNYFGEFCIWWGYWLIGVPAGGAWTVFAPAVMSMLLWKVSGVSLLEKTIGDRRPEYAEYKRRTSTFWPWPPKA